MLVAYWMNQNVVTIDSSESIAEAAKLLEDNAINMLPVLEDEKLVGVITDRDIKRAAACISATMDTYSDEPFMGDIAVRSLMSQPPVSVEPDLSVEETAEVLLDNKIHGVPVVEKDGRLVGVITQTDLFRVLIALTGARRRGIQFALTVKDRTGSIRELEDTIRKYGGRMACILTSYERAPKGFRRVYIRMYGIDRFKLNRLKEELSRQAELHYVKDHREVLRGVGEYAAERVSAGVN